MRDEKQQSNSSIYERFILIFEISAALWVHIVAFETTLRNFLNESLQQTYGVIEWWAIPDLLSKSDRNEIDIATKRLKNRKLAITNENIVSNLSLSFWIQILRRRYHETIWMKILPFFPIYPGRREDFYNKAREIRNLRNTISHHGSIMRRNLIRDHAYLHELTYLLNPELAIEVQKKSRVLDLLLNARLVGSGGGI